MRLSTRVSIYFVTLIFCMVLILSSALFFQFRHSYAQITESSFQNIRDNLLDETQKRGEVITALLAENLVNPFYTYDLQSIFELLNVTKNQNDILYTILYDTDGKIVHTGDDELKEFGSVLDDPQSIEAINTKEQKQVRITSNVMEISMPIWIGDTPLGGIKVGLSLDGITTHITTMENQFDIINENTFKKTLLIVINASIVFCLITVVFSLLFVLKLTRPIEALKSNAQSIGEGDYSQAIPAQYPGELGELANAFERMRQNLLAHETSLKKSEKKYRHLFNNAPVSIYEVNTTTNTIINANDIICQFLGYGEDELLALDPILLFEPHSQKAILERLKEAQFTRKQSDSIECVVIKKNGQKAHALLSYDFEYKKDGSVIARAVLHDITQRVESENRKIKLQKMIADQAQYALVGQIAGRMAHDFNNILGIIMANAEFSLMTCTDPVLKETLELILEQTLRGQNLTKNLLAFAKDQVPNQEFFLLQEKIDLVLNLMKNDLKHIRVVRDDAGDLPEILADPGMIEHALVNLVINAIHALSKVDDPVIHIRTRYIDQNIIIEVEDNGCGIPEAHIHSIYEPSFTLKGAMDEEGWYAEEIQGTGYGLSNVKKYIEQHKGTIDIESTVGKGTRVTISLIKVEKQLSEQEKEEIHTCAPKTRRRILLVEDEQTLSKVQYQMLTEKPFYHQVDVAPNGEVAKTLFRQHQYDLISLDHELPGKIKGIDIYNDIRKINQEVPILFNSGNFEFLESIEMLKRQDACMDAISKPCKNKTYLNSINFLLDRSEQPLEHLS